MPDRSLTYRLYGQDVTAGKAIDGVARKGAKAESSLRKMAGSAAAFLGGAAILKFGKDSVRAYAESQVAQTKLTASLAKNPHTVGLNAAAFADLNEELAKKTRFDDDASASGAAVLAQYKLTEGQIRTLLPLVQDYAAKTGKDLPAAAAVVGKALMGKGRALAEVGIKFKDAGSKGANFDQVVKGLRQQVGGFAEQEGKTAAGQAEILKNKFGEIQEKIGADLLPALMKAGDALHKVLSFADENSGTVKAIALVGGGLWGVNKALKVGKSIGDSTLVTLIKRIALTKVLKRETDKLTASQVAEAAAANAPRGGGVPVPAGKGRPGGKFTPLVGVGVAATAIYGATAQGGPAQTSATRSQDKQIDEIIALGAQLNVLRGLLSAEAINSDPFNKQLTQQLKDVRDGFKTAGTAGKEYDAVLDTLRGEINRVSAATQKHATSARVLAGDVRAASEAEAASIEPKTRLLKITDKQRDAYNAQVDAVRGSYSVFVQTLGKLDTGLGVGEMVNRMKIQLSYRGDLANAAKTLVSKGMTQPMLNEMYKIEEAMPGSMKEVAGKATPAFIQEMERGMRKLEQLDKEIANPLIAAADRAAKAAGESSADVYLRTFGLHVQKNAAAMLASALPGDVRAVESGRSGGSSGGSTSSPKAPRERDSGMGPQGTAVQVVELTPRSAAMVASAMNGGGGRAAYNGGRA